MSKKLFVGNLPFEVNDADLSTVLSVAGKVVEAKVILNKKTGRSKGYGFVEMETEELALEAVKKFEGATLNERPLTVQVATPKQESQAKSDEGSTESESTESESTGASPAGDAAADTSSA
jgi:RNA recognition motif-containing protein